VNFGAVHATVEYATVIRREFYSALHTLTKSQICTLPPQCIHALQRAQWSVTERIARSMTAAP